MASGTPATTVVVSPDYHSCVKVPMDRWRKEIQWGSPPMFQSKLFASAAAAEKDECSSQPDETTQEGVSLDSSPSPSAVFAASSFSSVETPAVTPPKRSGSQELRWSPVDSERLGRLSGETERLEDEDSNTPGSSICFGLSPLWRPAGTYLLASPPSRSPVSVARCIDRADIDTSIRVLSVELLTPPRLDVRPISPPSRRAVDELQRFCAEPFCSEALCSEAFCSGFQSPSRLPSLDSPRGRSPCQATPSPQWESMASLSPPLESPRASSSVSGRSFEMERLSRPSPSSCGRPSPNSELGASPESVTLEGCRSAPISPAPATASLVMEGSEPRRLYFELLEKDSHSPVRLPAGAPTPDRAEALDASEASSRPVSSPFSAFCYPEDPAVRTDPLPLHRVADLSKYFGGASECRAADRLAARRKAGRSELPMSSGSCFLMMDLVRQWASLCRLPSARSGAEDSDAAVMESVMQSEDERGCQEEVQQSSFSSRTIAALRLQLWFRQLQCRKEETCVAWTPSPCQCSLPREHTMLHAEQCYDMEQGAQLVKVIIPTTRPGEAFQVDWTPSGSLRKATCKSFQIQVPEGKQAGDELTLRLPVVAAIDGQSKREISRQLRAAGPLKWHRVAPPDVHWSCSENCVCARCLREGPSWVCDEMRRLDRLERYRWMRGCSMDPSVRTIEEGHSWWPQGPQPPQCLNRWNLDRCAAALQSTFSSFQSESGQPLPEPAFAIFAACLADRVVP